MLNMQNVEGSQTEYNSVAEHLHQLNSIIFDEIVNGFEVKSSNDTRLVTDLLTLQSKYGNLEFVGAVWNRNSIDEFKVKLEGMKSVVQFSGRLKKILDIVSSLLDFVNVKFTVQVLVTEVENDTNLDDEQHSSLNQPHDADRKKMTSQVHSDIELNSNNYSVLLFMVLLGTSVNRQSELINGLLGLKILHHQGRAGFSNCEFHINNLN